VTRLLAIFPVLTIGCLFLMTPSGASGEGLEESVYRVGRLKPVDSELKVGVGDVAPDFSLPSLKDGEVSLRRYRGEKNVVLSFVPAAWTPVCSDQWPGYNIARKLIEQHDAILLGITVDNLPTLHAWTKEMGEIWFPVLSDFWPHGSVAKRYGILRSDGTAERALFVIDKQGIIRYIDVHDINTRPDLDALIGALADLSGP
jgi:peroxiredoxin (alkyl hydroperoxide reductase subunit C)